jgi:hypothetical protein
MAQLVLGAVGAVVGFYVGGPTGAQIGFALGSAAGASMTTQKVQGPRLADLKAPQSSYGAVLPYVEGMVRTAGVWVWNSEKRETATVTERGGKGGPSVETTTYTYDMDVLILLSENKLGGLRRVWSNGKLVWSASENATEDTIEASSVTDAWKRITFYSGASGQLPDPTYEAAVGSANAPAYRGRGSVFIEGLNLGGSGQIPVLTFEVFSEGFPARAPFIEDFEDGLSVYEDDPTRPGSTGTIGSQFSIITGTPFGNAIRLAGGTFPAIGVRRGLQDPYRTSGFSFWTRLSGSLNSDDSGAVALLNANGSTILWVIPYRELGSDSLRRPRVFVNGSQYSVGTAAIPAGQWIQFVGISNYTTNVFSLKVKAQDGTELSSIQIPGVVDLTVAYLAFDSGRNLSPTSSATQTDFAEFKLFATRAVPDEVPLSEVVARQCERATIAASEYDVSALSGNVRGFAVSQVVSPRSVIEMLGMAYQFDAYESGGKVVFRPRAQASVATIPYDDLGASTGERPEPFPLARTNNIELPSQIVLKYANVLNDYQDGVELSDRLTTELNSVETTELALVLTPTEARRIVEIRANDIQNSVLSVQGLAVDRSYARLEPCDAVTVVDDDGTAYRLRILRISDSGLVRKIDGALDDQSVVSGSANTDENYTESEVVQTKAGTNLELLDIPLLRDIDDGLIHYLAVAKSTNDGAWPGAEVFRAPDDVSYTSIAKFSDRTYIGNVVGTLGNFAGGNVFDEVNALSVKGVGVLESWTRDQILNGTARPLLVGSEIVYYRQATPGGDPGEYVLRGLLRGRRGTEWAVSGHTAGERVVLLAEAGMRRVVNTQAELNVAFDFKGVTNGSALDSVTKKTFTNTGIASKPFAPVDLRASVVDGSTEVVWKRRTRLQTRFTGSAGINVPLGEAEEKYEVSIYSNSSPVSLLAKTTVTEPRFRAVDVSAATILKTYTKGLAYPYVHAGNLYGVDVEGSGVRLMHRMNNAGAVAASSFALSDKGVLYDVVYVGGTCYAVGHFLTDTVPTAFAVSRLLKFQLSTFGTLDDFYSPSSLGDVNCLAWDGTNIWSTGYVTGVLRKHAANLSVLETYSVGSGAWGLAYDAGTFYVGSVQQTKVRAYVPGASPAVQWETDLGQYHQRVFFHNGLLFVSSSSKVFVLDADDGSILETYDDGGALNLGIGATFSVVAGEVWYRPSVVNAALGPFRKLSATDGSIVGSVPLADMTAVFGEINGNAYGVGSPTNNFNNYDGYEFEVSSVGAVLTNVQIRVSQVGRNGIIGYEASKDL